MFKKENIHRFHILVVFLFSIFLRICNLGFSHFYGDETKTLYLDKSVPAIKFFFQQRKGPVQFLVAWLIEKITGGHHELLVRLPFALFGIFSVVILYFLMRKVFHRKSPFLSLYSTWLFSVSGFFIAFSRTAQYQSAVIFFSLLSFFLIKDKKVLLSGIVMGIALLCHYDAIFFLVPTLVDLIITYKNNLKKTFTFLAPLLITSGIFYIPYFLLGYFSDRTSNYIIRRLLGTNFLPNNSLYTYQIYNPSILYLLVFLPLVFLAIKFRHIFKSELKIILIEIFAWFLVPFITLEFIFSNPGTHIYTYILPLIILTSYGTEIGIESINNKLYKKLSLGLLHVVIMWISITAAVTYVPSLNKGYPWNANLKKNQYQLFLYGFPYNRGWDQAREFISSKERKSTFFTNDNITIGEYYLRPLSAEKETPQYFLLVYRNQQFSEYESKILKTGTYNKVKDIYVLNEKTMTIFERMD